MTACGRRADTAAAPRPTSAGTRDAQSARGRPSATSRSAPSGPSSVGEERELGDRRRAVALGRRRLRPGRDLRDDDRRARRRHGTRQRHPVRLAEARGVAPPSSGSSTSKRWSSRGPNESWSRARGSARESRARSRRRRDDAQAAHDGAARARARREELAAPVAAQALGPRRRRIAVVDGHGRRQVARVAARAAVVEAAVK